jgi:hypothetical protein
MLAGRVSSAFVIERERRGDRKFRFAGDRAVIESDDCCERRTARRSSANGCGRAGVALAKTVSSADCLKLTQ